MSASLVDFENNSSEWLSVGGLNCNSLKLNNKEQRINEYEINEIKRKIWAQV